MCAREIEEARPAEVPLTMSVACIFHGGRRKAEHARWLQSNPLYQESPDKYQQVWPFVPSDNVGLMKDGLAVQYDPYSIAPGSFGQPVIMIPYDKLKGIIRPEVVQIGSSGNK